MDGETPVGCVLGYPYAESRVLLIGYVTAKPGLRGRGIGALSLDKVEESWYGEINLVVAEMRLIRGSAP